MNVDLKEIREIAGNLLREIEYLKNNPDTDRTDLEVVYKKCLKLRDKIDEKPYS